MVDTWTYVWYVAVAVLVIKFVVVAIYLIYKFFCRTQVQCFGFGSFLLGSEIFITKPDPTCFYHVIVKTLNNSYSNNEDFITVEELNVFLVPASLLCFFKHVFKISYRTHPVM